MSVVYVCEKSHAMYEVARDVLQANSANDRVLLLHHSSTHLSVARDVLQANSADDRVLLLHHSSTDLSVPDYLPER